jgi:hypothetical protein
MDHEVLDCPRMIAQLEGMNLNQENPKADPEKAEPQQESEKVLIQMKETLNDHRHVRLSEIFKEKECIEAIIGDFDIDSVLDEETQVNIMPKITWKAIGRPAMIPSLGGIGLFRGKIMMLCGKLAQISMTVNGTSTKEDFEVIKFIEDSAPFTMLLGKPWIDRDHARKKEEEEVLEWKKLELNDFMTRKITQLMVEQEDKSKLSDTRSPDVEATGTSEDIQKAEVYTLDKEEMIHLNPRKESQQCKVAMSKDNKNQNGKRTTETKLTGKRDRKLSKKKAKIEKLQQIPEGTSQKETLNNWSFAEISEQRHESLCHGEAI